MAINRAKAKEFLEKNKTLLEDFDKAEALKQQRLTKLDTQRKAFGEQLKTLRENLEWMQVNVPNFENNPQYTATLGVYLNALTQTNAISQEAVELLTPKPEAPKGEEVFVPDPSDPSGFSSVVFAPGDLERFLTNPQALVNEVQRLRESIDNTDNPADRVRLQALTQVAGETEIQQSFQQPDVQVPPTFPALPSEPPPTPQDILHPRASFEELQRQPVSRRPFEAVEARRERLLGNIQRLSRRNQDASLLL